MPGRSKQQARDLEGERRLRLQAPHAIAADLDLGGLPNVRRDVELAPFTTFGIGGPADLLAVPRDADQLADAVRWARRARVEWFVLGCGANILVGDLGFRGLVIKNEAKRMTIADGLMQVESGAIVADALRASVELGLSGLEHYIEIPSTIGGAMWQNLHFLAPDRSRTVFIAEIVEGASVLSDSQVRSVDRDYFQFGYDFSVLHTRRDVVLDVTLALSPADPRELQRTIEANAAWRHQKHPPGAVRMSAGSIFRKIAGVGAGRLIDESGLKGARIGGAEVSRRHANYILNVDRASAADVRSLISHVQAEVLAHTGQALEPEISFVGEFAGDGAR
jgi:UDP-N-acetylmuramate dehydrogenase